MSARHAMRQRRWGRVAAVCVTLILSAAMATATTAQEDMRLVVNLAEVVSLERPARTIVVGNPEIADATVEDETTLILTGRAPGMTNLIAIDVAGAQIVNYVVWVVPAERGHVTIRDGEARQTFLCAPGCEPVHATPRPERRTARPAPSPVPPPAPPVTEEERTPDEGHPAPPAD